MAFGGFLKKKPAVPTPPAKPPEGAMPPGLARGMMNNQDTPAQLVMRMQRQGMTYPQIVGTMQREGYSQSQISDAMDQASQLAGQQPASTVTGGATPPNPAQASPGVPPPPANS